MVLQEWDDCLCKSGVMVYLRVGCMSMQAWDDCLNKSGVMVSARVG